ncbi:hypothetical protein ACINWCA92_1043 [Acinetobacter baumannii WC-A-92]|nr:hypothetical protein ACINWCA92_1043 [Acinetobacter baumannii WC-A-92]
MRKAQYGLFFFFSFIYQDKFSDIFLIFFDQFLVLIAKTI